MLCVLRFAVSSGTDGSVVNIGDEPAGTVDALTSAYLIKVVGDVGQSNKEDKDMYSTRE